MGLGSGILEKPIPDPGSSGQKGTGSRNRIRNTEFSYMFFSDINLSRFSDMSILEFLGFYAKE
jgi:hypothetical protein